MNTNKLIYRIATGLIVLLVGVGSMADLLKADFIKAGTQAIGFPEYMIPFLGTMKILGTITLITPALSRFREAAYAGMIFYFIGATYCHLAVGDGPVKYGMTLFILMLIIVSYLYSEKLVVKFS